MSPVTATSGTPPYLDYHTSSKRDDDTASCITESPSSSPGTSPVLTGVDGGGELPFLDLRLDLRDSSESENGCCHFPFGVGKVCRQATELLSSIPSTLSNIRSTATKQLEGSKIMIESIKNGAFSKEPHCTDPSQSSARLPLIYNDQELTDDELRMMNGKPMAVVMGGLFMWVDLLRSSPHSLGQKLEKAMAAADGVVFYVNYNTGRPIQTNGVLLSNTLQHVHETCPDTPVLNLVLFSMGGNVGVDALKIAEQNQQEYGGISWHSYCSDVATLGTPFHGAPLARFVAPLPCRSDAIRDLSYGSTCVRHNPDDDNTGSSREIEQPPKTVNLYAIAGVTSIKKWDEGDTSVGDLLVPVSSALGNDDDPALNLRCAERHVFEVRHHWELWSHPGACETVLARVVPGWAEKNSDTAV